MYVTMVTENHSSKENNQCISEKYKKNKKLTIKVSDIKHILNIRTKFSIFKIYINMQVYNLRILYT